ncbi:MAG: hypothetical protein MZV70_52485 [Desulfobacterales bacterium]|nr:hypothetical protein [Desulfobacterales bacterium]
MLDQLSQLWRNKTAVAGLFIITAFVLCGDLRPRPQPARPDRGRPLRPAQAAGLGRRGARRRTCSAPTTSAATSSRASSTAPGCRCWWRW